MAQSTLLWLDDCRDPFTNNYLSIYSQIGTDVEVVWVKSYDEFVAYIQQNGLPDAICFDHDLADVSCAERTGYDAAKFVVNYCLEHRCDIPQYAVQSSNPVGKEDIQHIMDNYHQFYLQN